MRGRLAGKRGVKKAGRIVTSSWQTASEGRVTGVKRYQQLLSHQPMLYFLSKACPEIPWCDQTCSILPCYLMRYHKHHPLYFDDGSSQHVCPHMEEQARQKSYILRSFFGTALLFIGLVNLNVIFSVVLTLLSFFRWIQHFSKRIYVISIYIHL